LLRSRTLLGQLLQLCSGHHGAAAAGTTSGIPGNSSSGGSGGTGDTEDAHPHITALAAVLGGASACMAALQRVEACHTTAADNGTTTAGATAAADSSTGTSATAAAGGAVQTLTGAAAAALHADAAAAAVSVLSWFVTDAALQQWQQRAQAAASNTDSTAAASSSFNKSSSSKLSPRGGLSLVPPDPQAMDFLVDELAFACQLCQRYLDFCAEEMQLDSTTTTTATASTETSGTTSSSSSDSSSDSVAALIVQLQVLVGAYVQLEDAYCLLNVKEALRIAEPIEVSCFSCDRCCATFEMCLCRLVRYIVHFERAVQHRAASAVVAAMQSNRPRLPCVLSDGISQSSNSCPACNPMLPLLALLLLRNRCRQGSS
jgi:COG4 transport protein